MELDISEDEAEQLADDLYLAAAALERSEHADDHEAAARLRGLAYRLL